MEIKQDCFENILENRVQFGKHQLRQFLIISFIDFLDGAEFFFISLLTPTLHKEWNLSLQELIILGSSTNFGIMIGSVICGFLADHLGRKNILILGTLLQTCIVLLTVIAQNIIQMTTLRLIYGIVIGMNLPISAILMIEVTPKSYRGKVIVALQVMILFGRIWLMILAYIFMESISSGNWRAIAICNSLPCIICFVGTLLWVSESPRFLINKDSIDQGINNLNYIGRINQGENYQDLNESEISEIQQWAILHKQHHQQQNHSIKQLFNKENLPVTWRNYVIFFLFMFVLLSIYNITPFILNDQNKSLISLFIVDFGEAIGVIFSFLSVDSFGRLQTLLISNIILIITLILIWKLELLIVVLGIMIFKFCCKINWGTLNILFAESYHTLYRSLGVGTTMAIGRIAGSLAPFIAFPIYFYDAYLIFLICAIISVIMLIVITFYPIDLTKKPLDQITHFKCN